MDWREPSDDFARRLAAARETVLANTTDPWQAMPKTIMHKRGAG
jgi:hypothetical protein